jgi:hypothetical protein
MRPIAYLPILALAAAAYLLAQVIEPWPEGRVLLRVKGLGPHGVTVSDVLVSTVVIGTALGWLFAVRKRLG